VSIPTSIITGLKGYPQFSPVSTSSKLDDKSQFPLFGRLVPSDDGTTFAAVMYLKKLNANNFAILHTNDAYGNAYAVGLQQAATEYAPEMTIEAFDIPFDLDNTRPDTLERIVSTLKRTNFRYFFGIILKNFPYESLMEEAVRT
jgi:ABC-type branched-subunit amino acid transport system substrate-binding protein